MIQHHVNYNMCGASVHDAAHDTSVISKQNLLLEFCADPKSRDEMQANTLPFIPNNQEAWHWSHFPLSCFFSFQIMPNPPVKNPMSENAKIILKNTPEIALWLSYFLTTKAVF